MEKTNLESFTEKVVEHSLSLVDERGIYAEDFERKVIGYLSGIFPNSEHEKLLRVYNVFQWEMVCNPDSPLDYVFPEKEGGKARIFFKNGFPDNSILTKKMIERYGPVLNQRIEDNLN